MTAAEIAKEFAGYIGSDDPEWVAKLGNQLEERIEALVTEQRMACQFDEAAFEKVQRERADAEALVRRLAGAMSAELAELHFQIPNGLSVKEVIIRHCMCEALASVPAHLLTKEEVKP